MDVFSQPSRFSTVLILDAIMLNFDKTTLSFQNVDSFQDIDLSKDSDQKILPDGNTISAKIENGRATEYVVKDSAGNLLKAIYLKMQSGGGGVIMEDTCQVCYTRADGVYFCVNIKCHTPVTVLT